MADEPLGTILDRILRGIFGRLWLLEVFIGLEIHIKRNWSTKVYDIWPEAVQM
jgi:hypothetical protein